MVNDLVRIRLYSIPSDTRCKRNDQVVPIVPKEVNSKVKDYCRKRLERITHKIQQKEIYRENNLVRLCAAVLFFTKNIINFENITRETIYIYTQQSSVFLFSSIQIVFMLFIGQFN